MQEAERIVNSKWWQNLAMLSLPKLRALIYEALLHAELLGRSEDRIGHSQGYVEGLLHAAKLLDLFVGPEMGKEISAYERAVVEHFSRRFRREAKEHEQLANRP